MNETFQPHVGLETYLPWAALDPNFTSYPESNGSHATEDFVSQQQALPYHGEQLKIYRTHYSTVHGYFSLAVCLFGITANVLNIIVLTRKGMLSPTNAILTGLAVADMLVMFSYVPFAIHNYVRKDLAEHEKYSYRWAIFTLFHANFTVVSHTISIWLTVTVAIWRFMTVCYPGPSIRWRGLAQARTAIVSTYVSCIVFCVPFYLSFSVQEMDDDGIVTYKVDFSELARDNDGMLEKTTFWLFSVVTKLVPCLALTILSFGLIRVLYEASLRRQRLKVGLDGENSHDRTTKMLLVVLLLFLVTEFPTGILALLSGLFGRDFFDNVYSNFGETMDILALVNSAVNFIIYCSMSRQFRDTFTYLFVPKFNGKWVTVPTTEPTQTLATACV